MTKKLKKGTSTFIAQHLNSEFQLIGQRTIQIDQSITARTNIYLVIATGLVGGLLLASTSSLLVPLIPMGSILVFSFILAIGAATLAKAVDLYAEKRVLLRRAGRIRRWFWDMKMEFDIYYPFSPTDDGPTLSTSYAVMKGADITLILCNATAATLFVVLVLSQIYKATINVIHYGFLYDWIATLLGIIIGLLTLYAFWKLQFKLIERFLHKVDEDEENEGLFHFPSPEYKILRDEIIAKKQIREEQDDRNRISRN